MILTSSDNPDFQVSRWLVVGTGVVFAAFFAMFVAAVLRTRRMPARLGSLAMVGNRAIARTDLDPEGYVFIEGERWKALAEDGPVRRGESVVITQVKGLTLHVRRRLPIAESTPAPAEPRVEPPPARYPPSISTES